MTTDALPDELWGVAEIMEWGKWSRTKAYRIVSMPGFPTPNRRLGHPQWVAQEVREWWDQGRRVA